MPPPHSLWQFGHTFAVSFFTRIWRSTAHVDVTVNRMVWLFRTLLPASGSSVVVPNGRRKVSAVCCQGPLRHATTSDVTHTKVAPLGSWCLSRCPTPLSRLPASPTRRRYSKRPRPGGHRQLEVRTSLGVRGGFGSIPPTVRIDRSWLGAPLPAKRRGTGATRQCAARRGSLSSINLVEPALNLIRYTSGKR